MAALATQNVQAGAAYTVAAAAGGGDTAETGFTYAGWYSPTYLNVVVGTTATVVTVNGVAQASLTSQSAMYPLVGTTPGSRVNITYSQVVNVTVGVVRFGPVLGGVTFGT